MTTRLAVPITRITVPAPKPMTETIRRVLRPCARSSRTFADQTTAWAVLPEGSFRNGSGFPAHFSGAVFPAVAPQSTSFASCDTRRTPLLGTTRLFA